MEHKEIIDGYAYSWIKLNFFHLTILAFCIRSLKFKSIYSENKTQWTVAKRACCQSREESTTMYGSILPSFGLLPSSRRSTWQSILARASKWSACYRFLPKSGTQLRTYWLTLLHFLFHSKNVHFGFTQMYVIPVKAGDRGRLSEKEIESQLLFILSDAPCVTVKPPPIGLLTGKS